MRLAIFGLTVSSSWGNGHATLWRGLWRALAEAGHAIVFFERDVPYYADHRDVTSLPGGDLVLYREWPDALPRARRELREADVVMVTSYCPDGAVATQLIADSDTGAVKVFYDMDTPVTLERLREGRCVAYIGPRGLRDFDLVLSYTGGPALHELQELLGAPRVAALYGHVDPQVHRRAKPAAAFRCDLSYLGTYAQDRQPAVDALFLQPARERPGRRFLLAGAQYPDDFPWSANIRFARHLPPPEHAGFFASSRRAGRARAGARAAHVGAPLARTRGAARRHGHANRGHRRLNTKERHMLWGIIPAAGMGTRMQPLGFSKELLPVGSSIVADVERPRAVSEDLVDRMLQAGAERICFVVAPGKADIVQYYGTSLKSADICYVVQPKAGGLCDAIFRACSLVRADDRVLVGLPDTIWFPEDGFGALPDDVLSFLLFPVDRPQQFDTVVTDEQGTVQEIQVKHPDAKSNWVWGAFKMPGRVLHELEALWQERNRMDEYIGTLVNAWIQRGNRAVGARHGEAYVDTGTVHTLVNHSGPRARTSRSEAGVDPCLRRDDGAKRGISPAAAPCRPHGSRRSTGTRR